jgi:hypothetical protein
MSSARMKMTPIERELADLKFFVTLLLKDLPTKRDWLDPTLEAVLKEKVK